MDLTDQANDQEFLDRKRMEKGAWRICDHLMHRHSGVDPKAMPCVPSGPETATWNLRALFSGMSVDMLPGSRAHHQSLKQSKGPTGCTATR